MTLFPLPLVDLLTKPGSYVVYLLIGVAFGYVLEISGFADSTKLAGQFYLKEMTVIKVMFTAIIVAMVLIFGASAIGLLDYNLIWVNPTYLWSGILGGLVMGFGFIIGGFCPGTSIVAVGTLKLDGIFFALGVFFGIFLFGETVGLYEDFWYSSYMGRFTLMDWLNLPTGVIVLLIVVFAIVAFGLSELAESTFGNMDQSHAPRWRYYAAGTLVILSVGLIVIRQPTTEDKWSRIEEERTAQLEERAVQIHPGELLTLMNDSKTNVVILDVRSEVDYNLFHIIDARHVSKDNVLDIIGELHYSSLNTAFIVVSNGEADATDVWKTLVAESIPNAYILEGGINNWLDVFADETFRAEHLLTGDIPPETLHYQFDAALGASYSFANPVIEDFEHLEFINKVKFERPRGPSGGGCG